MTKEKEGEKMMRYTFRLPESLLQQLQKKAGSIPVSAIIRRLIERYIKGEIGLD